MDNFFGTWAATSVENDDAFFDIFDLKEEIRQYLRSSEMKNILQKDGDNAIISKMEVGGKGREVKITLGEEFEDTAPSGDPYKATVTWEDGKFMGKMKFPKQEVEALMERRIDGEVMIVTITANGKQMIQKFKRE